MTVLRFGAPAGSVRVGVEAPELAPRISRLFAPLRLPADANEDLHLRIERAGRGWTVRSRDEASGNPRRFRNPARLLAAVEFALATRLAALHPDEMHLHASAAVVDGRAVLALGPSGAGKSSLALAWSVEGLPLLSDDRVFVAADGRVQGLPRLVKVTRGRLAAHGLRDSDTVEPDPGTSEVWWDPAERGGGWAPGPVPCAVVARVAFVRGSPTGIVALSPVEGLRLLLDHVQQGGSPPEASMDRLLEIAERASFVDVTFGAALEAARALAGLASDRAS